MVSNGRKGEKDDASGDSHISKLSHWVTDPGGGVFYQRQC